MKTNSLFIFVLFMCGTTLADAQRMQISRRTVRRPMPTAGTTQQTSHVSNSDAVFYAPLQPVRMAIPPHPHECGHDHGPSIQRRTQAIRMARPTSSRTVKWNNPAAYQRTDQRIGGGRPMRAYSHNSVCSAPLVEPELESFYASVRPSIPLYLPYRRSDIALWQGFYYSWGDRHGAVDYGRSSVPNGQDPSFKVYATGDGIVTDVKWSEGGGNIVTIEHSGKNGAKLRTTYLHLRNGKTNDRNQARKTSDRGRYYSYVLNNNSSLSWGTEGQKIAVRKGQRIKAGQFIGYAGNTGKGGIQAVLDEDGNIISKYRAHNNVHLHLEIRVWDSRGKRWLKVDPYGVYNKKQGIDCYDLTDVTPYARLWAPFFPSFHNVPLSIINQYWGYYTGMGFGLQTISVDRSKSGTLLASGAFQSGLPAAWYARFYMTANNYQQQFTNYAKQGFRPRQMQVAIDSKGAPRFSVIWEKNPSGQQYVAFHNRTDAHFSNLWNSYVKSKKYRLAEHVTYSIKGKRYHAGVFVKNAGSGFYAYYGLKGSAFDNTFKKLYSKWQLSSLHVNGSTVGGVWVPRQDNYAAYYGMTAADYQKRFDQFSAQGMQLQKVQSYANSTRFAAIWSK